METLKYFKSRENSVPNPHEPMTHLPAFIISEPILSHCCAWPVWPPPATCGCSELRCEMHPPSLFWEVLFSLQGALQRADPHMETTPPHPAPVLFSVSSLFVSFITPLQLVLIELFDLPGKFRSDSLQQPNLQEEQGCGGNGWLLSEHTHRGRNAQPRPTQPFFHKTCIS